MTTDARARTPAGRLRARGIAIPFPGEPGPLNAITDVPGVEVGYATRIEGDRFPSGMTAIHPRGKASPGMRARPASIRSTATAR